MRPRKAEPTTAVEIVAPLDDTSPAPGVVLTDEDYEFLDRAARFLVAIQNPTYLRRPRREGYTPSEHKIGWKLWSKAAGADRPLDHWLSEPEHSVVSDGAYQLAVFRELDQFEGTWLPRLRALIERVIPEEGQHAFTTAFFAGLDERPAGAAIVPSVRLFLDRIEALADSPEAGAKELAKKLVERGLTSQIVKSIRGLAAEAESGASPGVAKLPAMNLEEVRAAHEAQLGALKELRRWFNDWATMLRTIFGARDQVRLGLAAAKPRATSAPKPVATEAPVE